VGGDGVELIVRGKRVLAGLEPPREAAILIRDGKIVDVVAPGEAPPDVQVIDAGDDVVMPALVDTHAHINEPGRTDWEGFETATRACAAGGITTVVDMPLNSIPATTTLAALHEKARSADGHCKVDYAFWGGVVPGNARELKPMIEAGVVGFKCFLIDSGVAEFKHVGERELREAMPILARAGVPLIVHAELEGPAPRDAGDERKYQGYLSSRPRSWENEAIRMMIRLCRETGCRTHIVHLSSSDAVAEIAAARAEGLPFTAETCPHYLTFTSEEIPDGATPFKCAPPIREKENREKLWDAVRAGHIEFIVSDHSPCTPALKLMEHGDFAHAWGGISSLQLGLSIVWTGMRVRGFTLTDLTRLMCDATARFAGLDDRKGQIARGRDADLVIWAPEETFRVEPSMLEHRHKVTPYAGQTLAGVVKMTLLRGKEPKSQSHGRWLKRKA
jgi:allantoinase